MNSVMMARVPFSFRLIRLRVRTQRLYDYKTTNGIHEIGTSNELGLAVNRK